MDQGGGRGCGKKWSDLALILNEGLTRHAGVSKVRGEERTQDASMIKRKNCYLPRWGNQRTGR